MSWMFGAGMGLLMGGPLGAVVGGVLQHMVTKDTRERIMASPTPTNQETFFVTNLAAIMTKVAMADGHVSEDEVRVIHNFFSQNLRYRGEELRFIDGIIKETERINPDLLQICHAFKATSNPELRMLLIDLTYQIACSDHNIDDAEQNTINIIALQLDISEEIHQRIKNKYDSKEKEDNYTILGLKRGAMPDEIKKAYRAMALQYHPDKVSHLGEELIEFANNKFSEINTAYTELRKKKGF